MTKIENESSREDELAIEQFEGEGGSLASGPHQQATPSNQVGPHEKRPLRRIIENPYVSGVGASIIFEAGRKLVLWLFW